MPFSSFSFCSCKPDCVAGHAVKPITLQNTLTLFTPKIGVVMNSRMMMTQSNQSWIIEYRAYAPPSSHHILLKELLPKWCSHIPLCFASYTTPIKKRAPMMYSTPWIGSVMGRSSFLKGINLLVHILYLISTYCSFCCAFMPIAKLKESVFCYPWKNSEVGVQRILFRKGSCPSEKL